MQGSPYHGSPSPSPSSSSSRRLQNASTAANVDNRYTNGRTGHTLRPSPRKLQSYYITPGGAVNNGRLPPFSPQLSPHHDQHSARNEVGDKSDEAASPPPDEGSTFFQPEATTTAAAYNSPLLFSSKLAQKRFNAGPLYAEPDHPLYLDDNYKTPRGASRPVISPATTSNFLRNGFTPNDYPYAAISSPFYIQDSQARHSLLQRLRILPLQVQRFFRTRRKKALSPELSTTANKSKTYTSGRRYIICLCLLAAFVVYIIWPSGKSSPPSIPLEGLEVNNTATRIPSPVVPVKKWWQSVPRESLLIKKPRGTHSIASC